jgi:hypothetical protein
MYREWKETEFRKQHCIEFGNNRPTGRPKTRRQDKVREDGRIVGGEE